MASRQIFHDVEEALSREVRRITFWDKRTESRTVLKDTFNPFTGELVQLPVEPNFYDSSADASNIQYPNFFIRLMKTREDRFSGRVVPQYGKKYLEPITTSPPAYGIVLKDNDGLVSTPGNIFETSIFKIRKVQPGQLLRLLNGNNKGTYLISSITVNSTGDHYINLSSTLVHNMPLAYGDSSTGLVKFTAPIDLNTVQAGDIFIDSTSTAYPIVAVNVWNRSILLEPNTTPSLAAGASIARSGNVLKNTDSSVLWLVLDPTKVVKLQLEEGTVPGYQLISGKSYEVPLDVFYMIRIDSTEREDHIDIMNRMWEEFNPPRTALPTLIRSERSFEQKLAQNVGSGGSRFIYVNDTSDFKLDDQVAIIDDFHPTKTVQGDGFERPFYSVIASITPSPGRNTVVLGNQIITNINYDTNTLTLQDYSTGLPSNLSTISPGMQVVYNQLGHGPNSESVTVNIESINISNSTIVVSEVCQLQQFFIININQSSYGILELADIVPDIYQIDNNAKIVSNTDFRLFMFHFVDHSTKDIEGSQYWVHEFSFWVQIWVDRLEQPQINSTINAIGGSYGTVNGEVPVS